MSSPMYKTIVLISEVKLAEMDLSGMWPKTVKRKALRGAFTLILSTNKEDFDSILCILKLKFDGGIGSCTML